MSYAEEAVDRVCDRDTRWVETLCKLETTKEGETKGLTETFHKLPEHASGQ